MTIELGKKVPDGTTIDTIVVPEKLRERYKTGIGFVDACYGGQGLTPGTVTLLTGTPGAGKSTLALQIANALNKRNDAFSLFAGCEESLFQTKLVCERLFSYKKPEFYIGDDTIVDEAFSDLHHKVKMQIFGSKTRSSILGRMRRLNKKHPKKQGFLLVDSLQTVDDGKQPHGITNGNTHLRCLDMINAFCKKTFTAGIIIGRVTKSGDAAGSNKLIHNVDVWIHLMVDNKDKSETMGMRIIETKKNRYGYSGGAFVLDIDDNGLHECGAFATA